MNIRFALLVAFVAVVSEVALSSCASCKTSNARPDAAGDAPVSEIDGATSDASTDAAIDGATLNAAFAKAGLSTLSITNRTAAPTIVSVSFGAGSKVNPADWRFCAPTSSGCAFPLAARASQALPIGAKYLNGTFAFGGAPACNSSLGEVNINNPSWTNDTANISLVNGWNVNVEIDVSGAEKLGPTRGADANADVFGVYPNGCDICVARQRPPCGKTPCGGPDGGGVACGCKAGTQFDPKVPCQESFKRGAAVTIALVP